MGSSIDLDEIRNYVNENIDDFHKKRLAIISELTLDRLTSKNPYLLRAKNLTKASDVIEQTLEAFLSSSEEKLFGDFLEDLAIFIASRAVGGQKSTAPGMDLEFEINGTYYVVSIKSGTNWGNSSQHAKLASDFLRAERTLRQSTHVKNVIKILGICYGKTKTTITREGYFKIVGHNFWTLISGDKDFYIEIIEPLAAQARLRLKQFGHDNVEVRLGDGYNGWEERAPFQIIIVAAAPDHIPRPLLDQLAIGGRMVIPVGRSSQELVLVEKLPDGSLARTNTSAVAFVPMTGVAENQ